MGELAERSTAWLDQYWDPSAALLWNMDGSYDELAPPRSFHLVAQSAWYAAGLLLRGAAGDGERATRTIEAILATQYDEPGTEWHGTFARFLETPRPKPGAVMWVDFDPNWRQFVGTTFTLLLQLGHAGENLDEALRKRMRTAVARAVLGEPLDRVPPTYSNIALMRAWLEVEFDRPGALDYATAVVAAFDIHGTFEEYNSPTYYGIDLFALALWRDHSSSAELRAAGARLEEVLWRDIARWYHPTLRNLCGPWSRSYGMDMRRYVSLLGLWMVPLLGDAAPFPAEGAPLEHSHDFALGPLIDYLGAHVPPDAMRAMTSFAGDHELEQVIADTPHRVASGWLVAEIMAGGERGGLPASARGQYHPATAHWTLPDGDTGWLRLVHNGPARATARPGQLAIDCLPHRRHGAQSPSVRLFAGQTEGPADRSRAWRLPGLDVHLSVEPERIERDGPQITAHFALGTPRIELELHGTPL